jgi:hypothetical protein
MRKLALLLLIITVIMAALGSAVDQLPIDEKPIAFIDARSGSSIEKVLLIPKYSASTGLSIGAGQWPGWMTYRICIASPVIYQAGRPLRLRQPRSIGLALPPLIFVGQAISIHGATVFAPGYEGAWIWSLWERNPDHVELLPLGDGSEDRHNRKLALLERSQIRGQELNKSEMHMFDLAPSLNIDVRFTDEDRQLIREFLGSRAR